MARRPGSVRRLTLWCRRQPAVAGTIIAALAVVAAVAVLAFQRVVVERDAAQTSLYEALTGQARALIQAREVGWWPEAMDRIERAAALDVPVRDSTELRGLVAECMAASEVYTQFELELPAMPAAVRAVAWSDASGLAAAASVDGTLRVWRTDAPERAIEIATGRTLGDAALTADGTGLVVGDERGRVSLWRIDDAGELAAVIERSVEIGVAVEAVATAPSGDDVVAGGRDGAIWSIPAEGEPVVLHRHPAAALAVAFSPNGDLVASGGHDNAIRIWSRDRGQLITNYGLVNSIGDLAWESDDGLVYSTPESYTLGRLRLLATGGPLLRGLNRARHPNSVSDVLWDRNGRIVTACLDGSLRLWDPGSERILARARRARTPAQAIALGARGELLAGYQDGSLLEWRIYEPGFARRYRTGSVGMSFIEGGRRLFGSAGEVRDPERPWAKPERLGPPAVSAVVAIPGGVALGRSDGTIERWQLEPRRRLATWRAHGGAVTGLVARGGDGLVSSGEDGAVVEWRGDRRVRSVAAAIGAIRVLAAGDGNHVAAGGEGGVVVWRWSGEPREVLREVGFPVRAAVVDRGLLYHGGGDGAAVTVQELDGGGTRERLGGRSEEACALTRVGEDLLAMGSCDGVVRIWSLSRGAPIASWSTTDASFRGLVPIGREHLVGYDDRGRVFVWRIDNPTLTASIQGFPARSLAVDDERLMIGTPDGAVGWLELIAPLEALREPAGRRGWIRLDAHAIAVPGSHVDRTYGMAVSDDGRWIATTSHDRTVKLWDGREPGLVRSLEGSPDITWGVAFSASGDRLATGSRATGPDGVSSGEIRLWSVPEGELEATLRGHDELVTGLAFSADGRHLFSSSFDGTLIAWRLADASRVGSPVRFEEGLTQLAISPDGRWLAAAGAGDRLALWPCEDLLAALEEGREPSPRWLGAGTGRLWAVTFSRVGRQMAAASEQGEFVLWDVARFERRLTLRASASRSIRSLRFNDQGDRLVGAGWYTDAILWDLGRMRKTLARLGLDWEAAGARPASVVATEARAGGE